MLNDKEQFKAEFKKRVYAYTLRLIRFIEKLPRDHVSSTLGRDQLLRSGTSIVANFSEARAASSKKDFINFSHIHSSHAMRRSFGSPSCETLREEMGQRSYGYWERQPKLGTLL